MAETTADIETVPKLTADIAYISKLSNSPNRTDGLTATQLKARFDQAGQDIQAYVNGTADIVNKNFTELSQSISSNVESLTSEISDLSDKVTTSRTPISEQELYEILV